MLRGGSLMADRGWPLAIALTVVGVLGIQSCNSDPVTGAKVAAGSAAAGVGVGVGIGAGAAGAGAVAGGKRAVSKRVEDAISGRSRPQNPRNPTTTTGVPSPSIPPTTTTTTRPRPTPTTRPKTDMAPDWCVQIEAGTCVTIGGRR